MAAPTGGRALPLVTVVLATVACVVLGGRLSHAARRTVLWFVLASPAVIGLIHRRSLLGDGPLDYANSSAALYVVAAAGGLLLALSTESRRGRTAAWLVAGAWLVVPFVLGAVTAAMVGIAVAGGASLLGRVRLRSLVITTGVLTIGLLAIAIVLGASYEPGPRSGLDARVVDHSIGEMRVLLWSEAVDTILAEPVTGVGPGRFRADSPAAASRGQTYWAHNEFLHVAAETGVTGGVLMLALIAWCVAYLRRTASGPAAVIALITFMGVTANANIDYIWHFVEVPLALGLLLGATAGLTASPRATPAPRVVTAIIATFSVWILLLLPIEPLNPGHSLANGASLSEDGVLAFDEPGIARSQHPPERLYQRLRATHAFTIEVWAATADTAQGGPARIVSFSQDIIHRNLTVGQEGDHLVLRLRTTETDWNGSDRQLEVPDVFTTSRLRHLVVTTDVTTVEVYVDGAPWWRGAGPGGTLDGWNHTYPLLLGNEKGGDRPWSGEIHGIAIHDRVLSALEAEAAFRRGPLDAGSNDASGGSPIALYTFVDAEDGRVADESPAGLAGDLVVPPRVPAPQADFTETLRAIGHRPASRILGHLALFLAWGIMVAVAVRGWIPWRMLLVALMLAGTILGLFVAVVRYETGRSPAWVDIAAGSIGGILAALVVTAWSRGRRKGTGQRQGAVRSSSGP